MQTDESARKSPSPARCVAGALIRDDEILLVKRSLQASYYPGVWDRFGGHVEKDETVRDALHREAVEELQVRIERFQPLGSAHDPVEPADITVFAVWEWKRRARQRCTSRAQQYPLVLKVGPSSIPSSRPLWRVLLASVRLESADRSAGQNRQRDEAGIRKAKSRLGFR